MEYEALRQNDDGTVQVKMTIGNNVLEQAIDPTNLDENVKQAMAVFKSELDRIVPNVVDVSKELGKQITVTELPTIPPEDLEPVAPEPTQLEVTQDEVA